MCGIVGVVFDTITKNLSHIQPMTDTLSLRGPDDCGCWIDQNDKIAFGHRRLSVLDLSVAGHQPMISQSGRFVIVYNGEIYNYLHIRDELLKKGVKFAGHSDTEVILAAFEYWGVVESVTNFNGMFAFAVWDKKTQKLFLARDRFGEKPLYYGWVGGVFVFGSELKALKKYRPWKPQINESVLSLYLRYSYIPEPYSIYKNIFKLTPGCILEVAANQHMEKYVYWSSAKEAQQTTRITSVSENDAIENLHNILVHSVKQRCIADVPIGMMLSGGIDSTLITSLMQECSSIPIKTFTIGFYEKHFNNEAPYAKKIANHLKTNHTELYIADKDAEAVIPKLPTLYDEPFADSSQIPTYLVSNLARQNVTVCLSGDGGDELFGGYNRYIWLDKVYRKFSRYPHFIWHLMTLIRKEWWDATSRTALTLLPIKMSVAFIGDKIHKVARAFLAADSKIEFYHQITSNVNNPLDFMVNPSTLEENHLILNDIYKNEDAFINWMMLADTINYLPGDILTKVDRAAMGVSLETRIPFLDPQVFKFAWQLPLNFKIRDGQNKYILRQLLYRYVPKELIERPKVGFGVPVGQWIKGSLKDWADDLLDENRLKQQGFFRSNMIQKCWREHLSGTQDWTYLLWNFLMFQAWLQENN